MDSDGVCLDPLLGWCLIASPGCSSASPGYKATGPAARAAGTGDGGEREVPRKFCQLGSGSVSVAHCLAADPEGIS